MIPKADKDLKFLTNRRPLTLLNTFYKIISGVLANRLKTVLGHLIGPEQKGYVPNRFIGEVTTWKSTGAKPCSKFLDAKKPIPNYVTS